METIAEAQIAEESIHELDIHSISVEPVDIHVPRTHELVTFVRHCESSNCDIELCYQCFGDLSIPRPVVLLICGLNMQLTAWDEAFCEDLVLAGFHVIRFDNRDSGYSTKITTNKSSVIGPRLLLPEKWATLLGERVPYSIHDMALDALSLLSKLHIPAAHVFGISMGGMIAQAMAIAAPERIISLTSIMSTTNEPNLPDAQMWVKLWMLRSPPRKCTVEQLLAFRVRSLQKLLQRALPLDTEYVKARYLLSLKRSTYAAGLIRQAAAIRRCTGRDAQLRRLNLPSLVIHGAQDLVVPPAHGYRTAMVLPHARLLIIKNMGHYFHPAFFNVVVCAFADMASTTVGKGVLHSGCAPVPCISNNSNSDSNSNVNNNYKITLDENKINNVEDKTAKIEKLTNNNTSSDDNNRQENCKDVETSGEVEVASNNNRATMTKANNIEVNHLSTPVQTSIIEKQEECTARELFESNGSTMASISHVINFVVASPASPTGRAACASVNVAVPISAHPSIPQAVLVDLHDTNKNEIRNNNNNIDYNSNNNKNNNSSKSTNVFTLEEESINNQHIKSEKESDQNRQSEQERSFSLQSETAEMSTLDNNSGSNNNNNNNNNLPDNVKEKSRTRNMKSTVATAGRKLLTKWMSKSNSENKSNNSEATTTTISTIPTTSANHSSLTHAATYKHRKPTSHKYDEIDYTNEASVYLYEPGMPSVWNTALPLYKTESEIRQNVLVCPIVQGRPILIYTSHVEATPTQFSTQNLCVLQSTTTSSAVHSEKLNHEHAEHVETSDNNNNNSSNAKSGNTTTNNNIISNTTTAAIEASELPLSCTSQNLLDKEDAKVFASPTLPVMCKLVGSPKVEEEKLSPAKTIKGEQTMNVNQADNYGNVSEFREHKVCEEENSSSANKEDERLLITEVIDVLPHVMDVANETELEHSSHLSMQKNTKGNANDSNNRSSSGSSAHKYSLTDKGTLHSAYKTRTQSHKGDDATVLTDHDISLLRVSNEAMVSTIIPPLLSSSFSTTQMKENVNELSSQITTSAY